MFVKVNGWKSVTGDKPDTGHTLYTTGCRTCTGHMDILTGALAKTFAGAN
jgi:hypothetical protein